MATKKAKRGSSGPFYGKELKDTKWRVKTLTYGLLFISLVAVFYSLYRYMRNMKLRVQEQTVIATDNSLALSELSAIITKLEEEQSKLKEIISSIEETAGHKSMSPGKIITLPKDNHQQRERTEEASLPASPVHENKNTETSWFGFRKPPTPPIVVNPSHVFPDPITYNTKYSDQQQSVLVVGGTDGSGTRRVVQILTKLGVTMVSEDPETYDIHGDLMGGWPPVVNPVLQHTKSIVYDVESLPSDLKTKTAASLRKLIDQAERDSHKPQSYRLAVGGALKKPSNINVKNVKFGFKAPVAMTLAPWWQNLLPNFRLLHVLRDGRDIAFSANQGPVQKFYDAMYGKQQRERGELKAIRLWSDWNAGLREWAEKIVKQIDAESVSQFNGKSFGYYALHSEDLVSDNRAIRFAAISNLAHWLGSDINEKDLCCLSLEDSEFMGSHDRTPKKKASSADVSARYGKWKAKVAKDAGLEKDLHTIGAKGLSLLGYEPLRRLAESDGVSKYGQSCTLSEEECGIQPPPSVDMWGVPGMCKVIDGVDYKGGDISAFSLAEEASDVDYQDCCRKCQSTANCRHFTVDTSSFMCYLKSSKGMEIRGHNAARLVSGDVIGRA